MRPAVDASITAPPATTAPCVFMAELVDLLGGPPAGRAKLAPDALAGRLDQLGRAAHRHGASEATVAAIESARALLRLAEAPLVFVVRPGAVH